MGGCVWVGVCMCACARVRVGACARVCACVCMSALACLPVFANSISLLPRKKVSSWARRRRPSLPPFFLASAGTPRPQTRAWWLVHARGCRLQAVTGHTGVGVEPAAWCTLVAVGYGQLRAVAAVAAGYRQLQASCEAVTRGRCCCGSRLQAVTGPTTVYGRCEAVTRGRCCCGISAPQGAL